MTKTSELTVFRLKILREASEGRGSELPTGYREAGRDASRWWGAVKWLSTAGLVTLPRCGTCFARITDAGRKRLELSDRIVSQRTLP